MTIQKPYHHEPLQSNFTTMDPLTISAIVGAGGAALSNATGIIGAHMQNKNQKALLQYQNQYNERMWHMQNEYNSPKQTMQRLVDAGLNPRAIQNLGPYANAGSPASSAGMSYVNELAQYQSVAKAYYESKILQEQYLSMKQQRKNASTQGEGYGLDNVIKTLSAIFTGWENGVDLSNWINPTINKSGSLSSYFQNSPGYDKYLNWDKMFKNEREKQEFMRNVAEFDSLSANSKYKMLKEYGITGDEADYISQLINMVLRTDGKVLDKLGSFLRQVIF